jgi:hypothetical protein
MLSKIRGSEETRIQCLVVDLLEAYARPDIVWFAVPNGGYRYRRTAYEMKRMGVRAGVADLIFLVDGKFHAVEIKAPSGRVETSQKAFCVDVERAGGTYTVTFGANQTVRHLKALDVFNRNVKFTFPEQAEQQTRKQTRK